LADDLPCHRHQPRVGASRGFLRPYRAPVHQPPQALLRVLGAHPVDRPDPDAQLSGLGLGA
jgi:hypothetical protein